MPSSGDRAARIATRSHGRIAGKVEGKFYLSQHGPCQRYGLLLAFLAMLFWHIPVWANGDPWAPFEVPDFDIISTNSGLPHSVTTAVVQDRRGLIWAGTMGGLVRYDGLHVQVFDSRLSPPAGLPDAYVRCLLALPDGGILIGTNAGGLVRFNPRDNQFESWPIGPGGTSNGKIYALASDHDGGVWVATDNGLDHLDLASGKVRAIDSDGMTAGRNFTVYQDRAGNVWVGNQHGLAVRKAHARSFERLRAKDADIDRVLRSPVWAIDEDRSGRLWLGSVALGAVYRDTGGVWHGVPGLFSHDPQAQWPTVRAITSGAGGQVWLATDGFGTIRYEPGARLSRRIRHDPAIVSSLPGDTVRALLFDRGGNIWMATNLGLAVTDPEPQTAFALRASPVNPHALSGSNVHNVFVDSRQRIWLGLDSGRIDIIDLANGSMRHLRLESRQAHRDVLSFLELPNGTIWAGSDGLVAIDPDTLRTRGSLIRQLDDKPILSLAHNGNRVLIGTYEGLFQYDLETHKLSQARHQDDNAQSLVNDTVHQIARIGEDFWYATAAGISIASTAQPMSRFHNLVHRNGRAESLPQDYVGSIRQDDDGKVWISTFGGLAETGPAQTTSGMPRFRIFNTANGLSSNKVNATLVDPKGMVWMSVSNGINVLNPTTGTVQTLGRRDGLGIDSYVNIAAAHAPGGNLLFGGLGGLTVIRPDLALPTNDSPPLAVTNAILGGKSLPFADLPEDGDTATLSAHARNMQLDFALLDYRDSRQTRYSYRLDGLDRDWTPVVPGNTPSAIYTNLPYGTYTLILRATVNGLFPQQIESRIRVDVQPLWFETLAARLAGIALLLALIVGLVYLRTWVLHRRARELQAQIDLSTRELREANSRLDQLAGTDSLTGVLNRRRFLERVEEHVQKAPDQPVCMALLDLDHFKQVNDSHGHLAGDEVLRATADVIREHCRVSDLIGRFGGEELMICMPGTRIEDARNVAERIRKAQAEMTVRHEQQNIGATISIGIALRKPDEPVEHWLERADSALYRAKHGGRNRTAVDQWTI